jgi:hypothetical protein
MTESPRERKSSWTWKDTVDEWIGNILVAVMVLWITGLVLALAIIFIFGVD